LRKNRKRKRLQQGDDFEIIEQLLKKKKKESGPSSGFISSEKKGFGSNTIIKKGGGGAFSFFPVKKEKKSRKSFLAERCRALTKKEERYSLVQGETAGIEKKKREEGASFDSLRLAEKKPGNLRPMGGSEKGREKKEGPAYILVPLLPNSGGEEVAGWRPRQRIRRKM